MIHVGIGYDVHQLVAGRKLILGGVEIPHDKGLDGHSDADALMHAVCDAVLGAIGEGDIGQFFPNTDPQVNDVQMVRRLTPDPLPAHAPFDRITLTLPALLNSDALLFTLGGSEAKRSVFESAIAGEHDLPISRLLGAATQPVTCFA
mgnify:CR=1 FL=1